MAEVVVSPDSAPKKPTQRGPKVVSMIWTLLSTAGVAVTQILVVIGLSRLMSPTEVGWAQAVTVIAAFSTILTQMGLAPALVQRQNLTREHESTAYVASFLTGVLLTAAIMLGSAQVAGLFKFPEIHRHVQAISLVFLFSSVGRISMSRLARDVRFKTISKIEMLGSLSYGVVSVTLAALGWSVWSVVVGLLLQAAIQAVLMTVSARLPFPLRFDMAAYKELMSFARGFTAAALLGNLAGQLDNFVVGRMLGPAAMGLYSRSYSLVSRPALMLATSINRVLYPYIARAQDDQQELHGLFVKSTVSTSAMIMPIGITGAIIGPELIVTLLGRQWVGAILPFQILAAGMVLRIASLSCDTVTRAMGDMNGRVVPKAIYCASVLGLSLAGVRWGLPGVAAGIVAANLIHAASMAHYSLKHLPTGWWGYLALSRAAVVLSLISCVPTYLLVQLMRSIGVSAPVILIAGISVAALLFAAAAKIGKRNLLGEDFVQLRQSILQRSKKSGAKRDAEISEALPESP